MNSSTNKTVFSKRSLAIITGLAIVMMAISGGYALGYAFPTLFTPDQGNELKDNVLNNLGMYQTMVIGILITLVLDLVVSYGLYAFFVDDDRKLSLAAGLLRFIYTLIFGVATFYLAQTLMEEEPSNQTVYRNFELFEAIWFGGLVLFGVHLIVTGILMDLHRRIPKVLGYLTLVAGVAYIIIHLARLADLNPQYVKVVETILTLPMVLGELGLAIWLWVKGGKKGD